MSSTGGNQNPFQQFSQTNAPHSGGTVYANQGGNQNITNNNTTHTLPPAQSGPRTDTKVLLVTLVVDVAFFFYGMFSYSGENTKADDWRAGIFLLLLVVTIRSIRRWVRKRA